MGQVRRSAPTMSAACCVRRNCCGRARIIKPAIFRPRNCVASRTRRFAMPSGLQQEVGLQGVTDGEFRRGSWHMDFLCQIGGVAKTDRTVRIQFRNEAGPVEAALGAFRIGRRLSLDKTIFAEHFAYLKSVAPTGTVAKLTIPSPSMLHYRGGRAVIDRAAYPEMASTRQRNTCRSSSCASVRNAASPRPSMATR